MQIELKLVTVTHKVFDFTTNHAPYLFRNSRFYV
jgi:hypothetical protein